MVMAKEWPRFAETSLCETKSALRAASPYPFDAPACNFT
jgi:hypothetical protein